MTHPAHRRERTERICFAALERPAGERAAFVRGECGDDDGLRQEVEALLAKASAADRFLDRPLAAVAAEILDASNRDASVAQSGRLTGRRVGVFEIGSLLGVGGMGEIYRARDAKLKREVALKVVPEAFVLDRERLARFRREAQVLASLNHPNIAAIYGLEESEDVQALVLELVEGPTLADRIARGPIPLSEALTIATQITDALETAHESGVIHRDLKPANIKVRADGVVKVLDFGLAKILGPDFNRSESSNGSTVTEAPVTRAATILGTAPYMAPEQAVGQVADRRVDIWAFGVVLFEMLTATRPFDGETVNDVISEVLKSEPDWRRLPPGTPASIGRLLGRCLRKDKAQRLRDIADARIEIDDARDLSQADPEGGATTPGRTNRWLLASGLLLATAIAAVQSVRLWQEPAVTSSASEIRFEITTPEAPQYGLAGGLAQPDSLAISPDGLKVVYSGSLDGRFLLWVRSLSSGTVRALNGTEAAVHPFWSPDSRSVGFFADSRLKRIDIDGGTIRTLTSAPFGVGGTWSADGTIVFSPVFSGPLYRVPEEGGEPTAVTQLASGDVSHRVPLFLPDGRHFLYVVAGRQETSGIYVGDLDGSPARRLVDAEVADVHQPSSRLLFVRQGTLFSQRLDTGPLALTGSPVPLAQQVVAVSASGAGAIAYRTAPRAGRRQLVQFNRSGQEMGRVGIPDETLTLDGGDPALSPDGLFVAMSRLVDGNADIWLVETARGVPSRFTTEMAANYAPRWSPDGERLVFNSDRSGVFDLYVRSAHSGASEELLLSTPQNKSAADWSPDGRFLLFRSVDPVTSHDLWALPLDGAREPFPVVRTNFVEASGQFSPDGKWIAYQSNESGRHEVYAQRFPDAGRKLRISTNGGGQMRWRRDGRELFYLGLDSRLMAVSIRPTPDGEGLEAGDPVPLFTARVGSIVPLQSGANSSYVVSPDGMRFLMNTFIEEPATAPITVILNWSPPR